jgi:uncharacterized protein (TIGR03067 family)
MEGTWSAVSQTKDGKATPADQLTEERLVIKAEHWRVLENGRFARLESQLTIRKGKAKPEMAVVLAFDPNATPKKTIAINFTHGIYQIEGDDLMICLAPFGKDRPTEFKAPAGSGLTLTTYKRVQAENKGNERQLADGEVMRAYRPSVLLMVMLFASVGFTQELPTSPPVLPTNKGKIATAESGTQFIQTEQPPHLTAWEGTWAAVSQPKYGKATPADQLQDERLVIEGRRLGVWVYSRKGSGRLDRVEDHLTISKGTAKPEVQTGKISYVPFTKAQEGEGLSLIPVAVPTKAININMGGLWVEGIWEIEGDQLKICLAPLARPGHRVQGRIWVWADAHDLQAGSG